jgi:hypothetical protein
MFNGKPGQSCQSVSRNVRKLSRFPFVHPAAAYAAMREQSISIDNIQGSPKRPRCLGATHETGPEYRLRIEHQQSIDGDCARVMSRNRNGWPRWSLRPAEVLQMVRAPAVPGNTRVVVVDRCSPLQSLGSPIGDMPRAVAPLARFPARADCSRSRRAFCQLTEVRRRHRS